MRSRRTSFSLDDSHSRHNKSFDLDLVLPTAPVAPDDGTSVTAEEECDSPTLQRNKQVIKAPQQLVQSVDHPPLHQNSEEEPPSPEDVESSLELLALTPNDQEDEETRGDEEASLQSLELAMDGDDAASMSVASSTMLTPAQHALQSRHNDSLSSFRFHYPSSQDMDDLSISRRSAIAAADSATVSTTGTPRGGRLISFGAVTVHYHAVRLGDSSFCVTGPPVALGTPLDRCVFDSLRDYERVHQRTSPICPRLAAVTRRQWLLQAGISHGQMRNCMVQLTRDRQRRERSLQRFFSRQRALQSVKCVISSITFQKRRRSSMSQSSTTTTSTPISEPPARVQPAVQKAIARSSSSSPVSTKKDELEQVPSSTSLAASLLRGKQKRRFSWRPGNLA